MDAAPARQTAMDTARMALAPRLDWVEMEKMAGLLKLPTRKRLSTDCYQQAAWFE